MYVCVRVLIAVVIVVGNGIAHPRVQILDEAVYVLHRINALRKCLNPYLLSCMSGTDWVLEP